MHINDEQVAALVHDNLASPETLIGALTHQLSCRLCGERVEAEQAVDTLVGQLLCVIDHAAPLVVVHDVVRRARVRAVRRAVVALILVVLGATAASAAIPGTPVHTLLQRAREHAPPVPAAEASGRPRLAATAISIVPRGGLDVVLPRVSHGYVRVRLTNSATAELSSTDPKAAYTLEENRIVVRSLSTADYQLSLPAALQSVHVTMSGRVLYAREGGVTHCSGTLSEATCLIDFGAAPR
jgi:hypothetical protein